MLDVVADLRAIVLPDVARTVGVLQELLLGGPVVAQGDVAGAFVGVEVEPVVGVVDVGRLRNIAYHILADNRARLIAEGIDAGTVVHVLGVVVNQVGVHLIIFHAHEVAVPAPAQRDAGIGDIVDSIVVNGYAIDISCTDGHTAPILVGDVVELAVADLLFGAHLTEVGGLIGQVSLQTFWREGAADVAVHGDVGEGTVCHAATVTALYVVESRTAEVFEAASLEVAVLGIAQFHGSIGTAQPALVVELVVVGTVYLWT